MKVTVRNNDIGKAYRVLKRKLQQEGVLKEMRKKSSYEKPSEKRKRQKAEAISRHKKALRNKNEL